MNLQQLTTFTTVVSEGSMTAAAEKLFLTQPAVSQQIRNLEDELGVALLDRGARHARPTVQGQLLYDYARRIIQLTSQAQVAVQTMAEGVEGRLRVGTLNSLGLQLVAPAVSTLLKHHSRVSVELNYLDSAEMREAIRMNNLDVIILPEMPPDQSGPLELEARALQKDEMWLVASGRDPSLPDEVKFEDLSQRPYVKLTERYESFDREFKNLEAKTGVKLKTVFECNNVGTMKRVIESGLGWGFLPAHAIRKQVRMGRLTQVTCLDLRHTVSIYFYSKEGARAQASGPLIDVFYRILKQGLGS